MKLTQKDKKMLIILTVFLLLVGYYEFVVEPLYTMSKKSGNQLMDEQKELLVLRTKVASLNNFKKKMITLTDIVQVAEKSSLMPFVDVALDNKIKAVMEASEKSGVEVKSIKPMDDIRVTSDGKSEIVKDKYFSIEGVATVDKLLKFLRNLWGTKLDSINVTVLEDDGSKLRYYIKIEFLTKVNFELDLASNIEVYKGFVLKHNPFTIIKPPPPPLPKVVRNPVKKKPPKIVHHLDNIDLIGIAQYNNKWMAVIDDKQKRKVTYLVKGDIFREAVVKNISDMEVTFFYSDNKQTITLKLKTKELKLKTNEKKKTKTNKKKGHLGIMVETFTQDVANRYKIEFTPGLFVISPGRHRNIFKKNDVIIEINDQLVPNFEAAIRIMNNIYSGDKIKITLKRDGKTKNLSYEAD